MRRMTVAVAMVVGALLAGCTNSPPPEELALTVTRFPVPTEGAAPPTIVTGSDGNLWFAESGGHAIGRITPDGVITEFRDGISSGCIPDRTTLGPDGAVWFTELGLTCSALGRITPDGEITEFPVGDGRQPFGVATGPDGNLWFTSFTAGSVGRLDPATGAVTHYDVSEQWRMPTDIVAGPDGAMWFTERFGGRVGRIAMDGSARFTVVPNPAAHLVNITRGPDGNLWYTDLADTIGRITPAGVVTEFREGIPLGTGPVSITTGSDGNLWAVGYFADRLLRITPTGSIVATSVVPPGVVPDGITSGPDGNIWFTEVVGNHIVRVVIPKG